MRIFKPFYSILFFLLLALNQSTAQEQIGFEIKYNAHKAVIPIEVINNLIIVPVTINNFLKLNFILDTGVNTSILVEPGLSQLLSEGNTRTVKVRGLGSGGAMEAQVLNGLKMEIGELLGYNMNMLVLPGDAFDISKYLGKEVHGIIGYDLFHKFLVKIDYTNEELVIYEPQQFKRKLKRFQEVSIEVLDGKPYLNTKISQAKDDVPVNLLVDSGASYAISLDTESDREIMLPQKTLEAYLGTGISGDLYGKIGRIEGINLNEFRFEKVIATYPDRQSIRHAAGLPYRDGSIGGELLKRFTVIFNYQAGKLYLKKNSKYREPFFYNRSGLQIVAIGIDRKIFFVEQVKAGSPADEAGIMAGDRIVSVNWRKVSDIWLKDIYNVFNHTKDGKVVKMQVLRGEDVLDVSFVIKSEI